MDTTKITSSKLSGISHNSCLLCVSQVPRPHSCLHKLQDQKHLENIENLDIVSPSVSQHILSSLKIGATPSLKRLRDSSYRSASTSQEPPSQDLQLSRTSDLKLTLPKACQHQELYRDIKNLLKYAFDKKLSPCLP